MRGHGNLRAEVLQLRGYIFDHRISLNLCEDDTFICRQSIFLADGQSALSTSSGLTSPEDVT
jgi:hypothetical protein